MWIVRGPVGSAVLYGTDHGVDPSPEWDTPKLAAALDRSEELRVESVGGYEGRGGSKPPPVTSLLLPPERGLPDLLSAEDRRLLDNAEQKLGLSPNVVSRFPPAVAAIVIAQAAYARAGVPQGVGAEAILEERAKTRGLPIKGLEPADPALRDEVFAPPTDQAINELRHALKDYPQLADQRAATVKQWESADLAGLARSCDRGMTPKLREDLVTTRNHVFARRIVERLSSPGVIFVAVGVCHLVGQDSLIALLRASDIRVERP
jgi:uncharacterized protein YbaP (TraB family)